MGTCKTYTQMALHKHEIPDLLSAAAAAAAQHGDGLQEEAMVFALEMMSFNAIIKRKLDHYYPGTYVGCDSRTCMQQASGTDKQHVGKLRDWVQAKKWRCVQQQRQRRTQPW